VYSYTVQHRRVEGRAEAGTVIAIVELDEGPRIFTNLVGVEPQKVHIGARVTVEFLHEDGLVLPVFRPLD
jgi:hypothetical protein